MSGIACYICYQPSHLATQTMACMGHKRFLHWFKNLQTVMAIKKLLADWCSAMSIFTEEFSQSFNIFLPFSKKFVTFQKRY